MLKIDSQDRRILIDPLFKAGRGFYLLVGLLLLILGWGAAMYIRQVIVGLGVTHMDRPAYWGLYMVNFIFFIGISHAGTLISAILRVTGAEWRRPITRIVEAITAFALIVGTFQILFDLGRPDRFLYVFWYGRLQSPLLWDAVSVTAYFLGSLTYLYMPIIPDAALMRDNLPEGAPRWRHILYRILALGWQGTRGQWVRLEKAIAVMAVLIIPVAISVHTIISWILATTVQPGWHSTVFGPYFVVGAIFSGIAALFIAMTLIRRAMHLETYITELQYRNMGLIFITMAAIWFYFTYAEHMTQAAGQRPEEFPILAAKLWGQFSLPFWSMVILMVIAFWVLVFPSFVRTSWRRFSLFQPRFALGNVAAAALLTAVLKAPLVQPILADMTPAFPRNVAVAVAVILGMAGAIGVLPWLKGHLVEGTVMASACVLVGMWLERWNIIVPTLVNQRLMETSSYFPSLTEWSMFAASIAAFILMCVLFFKVFPPVSIWEVVEGRVIDGAQDQIEMPMPVSSRPTRTLRSGFGDD